MEKIETLRYKEGIFKEKFSKKIREGASEGRKEGFGFKEKMKDAIKDACKHRIIVLKITQLTNYHFIQDHAFSIKPLYLKNV